MPHPFSPEDFPINQNFQLKATKVFYLRKTIHFKQKAKIIELTGQLRQPFGGQFTSGWADEAGRAAQKLDGQPRWEIGSCGEMMRTIKTMTDGRTGDKVAELNITFISFDSSKVRFPKGSPHSRHEVEVAPVDAAATRDGERHECFIRHSVPYFWDMTSGQTGVLYKCLNQQRCEVGRVASYGFDKDAILVLNADEVDEVVALSTAVILLNGRDAMDH
ncbi:hypothetical protein MGN70_005306 [Eutypa lata]|uniref:Uncharacterized protein n=1 Tax=Eutypa lata (strain UCR-EL1) TaxID=1287681 RepID=M7SF29_EUTLA|nr:hypothetical protein UCREL1_8157 [Eutypa lata UCREL1]KAI1253098.1 hypothetical protein MGN70_005306 [Eutypa lata]